MKLRFLLTKIKKPWLKYCMYLQVRETQTQDLRNNLSSPIPRFSVLRLDPGAQYQASLFSYNGKGRSEPIILHVATLRLPEKQLTAEKGE